MEKQWKVKEKQWKVKEKWRKAKERAVNRPGNGSESPRKCRVAPAGEHATAELRHAANLQPAHASSIDWRPLRFAIEKYPPSCSRTLLVDVSLVFCVVARRGGCMCLITHLLC